MTDWQAGPEMDAEIARRVFGAEERPCHLAGHCDRMHWYYPEGIVETRAPSYSEDIAAAWLVVEKMQELGYAYVIWHTPDISSFQQYPIVGFLQALRIPLPDALPAGGTYADGRTVSEAICRAALSVGVR